MRRRELITLLGGSAALWPLTARAQKPFKIGLLDTGLGDYFAVPFMRKLLELGYVEGRNVVIERKSAAGNAALLTDLAADLVRQQVDVIVTAGTPAGFAAKKATSTIPIVLGAQQRSGRCRPGRQPCPARREYNRQLADGA
jgi:putative tryptophan/tyrosine transport system substrate-binding protein